MRSIVGGAARAAPPQVQPRLDLQAAAGCFSLSLSASHLTALRQLVQKPPLCVCSLQTPAPAAGQTPSWATGSPAVTQTVYADAL